MQIPQIEPFTFIASTAFDERVQLANKINEIIDGINQIGDIPELDDRLTAVEAQVSTINQQIQTLNTSVSDLDTQVSALDSSLTSLTSTVSGALDDIVTLESTTQAQASEIQELQTGLAAAVNRITSLESRMTAAETDISEHDSEITGLLGEVIDSVAMSSNAHGTVQVQINHEDGSNDLSQPIDLALVQEGGITLQTGATDRSFNLLVNLTDGTSWQTNDFIIPPGGGTEIVVTNVQIVQGTEDDMMRVRIGLSDATYIESNDWTYVTPAQLSALTGRVTTLEGTTGQHTTQIGQIDTEIDSLDSRVSALEDNPFSLPIATASVLGGVKIGANITVTSDGTISVPVASGSANGVMSAADKAKLDQVPTPSTIVTTDEISDLVTTSELTNELANYATVEQLAGYATDQELTNVQSDLQEQISAIGVTASVNEGVDPPQLTVEVNGASSTVNLPSGGGEWEEFEAADIPQDFQTGDIIEATIAFQLSDATASSWNSALSGDPSITKNNYVTNSYNIVFPLGMNIRQTIVLMTTFSNYVRIIYLNISSANSWNQSNGQFLELIGLWFNGYSRETNNAVITRSDKTGLIRIKRLRP